MVAVLQVQTETFNGQDCNKYFWTYEGGGPGGIGRKFPVEIAWGGMTHIGFHCARNKLKAAGGSEKEINGKNLLLIAMMKKLEAFVEAGGFWLYEDLCLQSKEVSLPLENCQSQQKVRTHDSRTWFAFTGYCSWHRCVDSKYHIYVFLHMLIPFQFDSTFFENCHSG